jgi:hypothetical protein
MVFNNFMLEYKMMNVHGYVRGGGGLFFFPKYDIDE